MALLIKSIITSYNDYVIGLDGRSCKHIVIHKMQYLTEPQISDRETQIFGKTIHFPDGGTNS